MSDKSRFRDCSHSVRNPFGGAADSSEQDSERKAALRALDNELESAKQRGNAVAHRARVLGNN